MAESPRAKLEALAKALRVTHAKLGEQLDTFDALLAGESTPAQTAKMLVGAFIAAWNARYRGATYVPDWVKDLACMKGLLKSGLTADEIQARIPRYLASQDTYVTQARHPLGLFKANINKFSGGERQDDEHFLRAPVVDCQHTPKCSSDQQHTSRKMSELRSSRVPF
jgi:hypothetical protein